MAWSGGVVEGREFVIKVVGDAKRMTSEQG